MNARCESTQFMIACMRTAIVVAIALCAVLAMGCSGGSTSTTRESAPAAGATPSNNTNHSASTDTAAAGDSGEAIDSRYVGEWTGHDIYTMEDVSDTYVLYDNGDWATLVVNADGSGSLEGSIGGEYLSVTDLQLEYGTVEYLVYDSYGELFGSLGYQRSGTTDWLILSIPDEDVGMVCYTFFINN